MTDLVSIPQDAAAQPQGRELKWFIIHTYSGYEAKVMEHLRQRIQMEERQDSFGDIQIPEETYEEMKVDAKSGKKERVVKKRKSFPGYLLVQIQVERKPDGSVEMADADWHLVRNTPKVTSFVGANKKRPTPLTDEEVRQIMHHTEETQEKPKPKYHFEKGEKVRIIDGPFANFEGRPFMVVANAGTTNTGAVDPLPEVAAMARRHGLWLHVDAAYGGFFRLAPEGRVLLAGIEAADSITLDPHKGLFLPYGTGCLLVRDPSALRRAHANEAHYLQDVADGGGAVSFTDLSPELSRDFRGLRVWLPIMLHGLGAFREQLSEKLQLARWAHAALADEPGLLFLDAPQLSALAFRARPRAGETDAVADARSAELMKRVNAGRRVFLSSTVIGGRFVVRLCVLSFRTHQDRVAEAVEAIRAASRDLA